MVVTRRQLQRLAVVVWHCDPLVRALRRRRSYPPSPCASSFGFMPRAQSIRHPGRPLNRVSPSTEQFRPADHLS